MFVHRPLNSIVVCAAAVVGLVAALAGCASGSGTQLSGRVVDDVAVVSAPVLPAPTPFPIAANARSRTATVAAVVGLGQAQRIVSVPVQRGRPGERG